MSVGSLRIIAGSLKGRKIRVPEVAGVRPTPDRVREAMFSILGETVAAARVLDVYAGSGSLGLEAYSRGASTVVFLESDRVVCKALQSTLEDLAVTGHCRTVLGRAGRSPGCIMDVAPFDLVLADPPYSEQAAADLLIWLSDPGLVAEEGRVVLERESGGEATGGDGSRFQHVRTARYGRTALDFYSVSGTTGHRPA
ncbi:MAG: 16S rRNA (guanine(966)-N(2))-methyltransferase RsmD [Acidobacteria bacterium]|uniref:16S rRNA (Guanine(966)-N(2))-methyltransferase RsmD n=1 Tax=Candidatus Polarisedimenticola svalbardensis TaxID=2886004 RepID=A0A8J6XUB1_9BACT|nr:16S rRNA (guanine(966)-N(2))-methyltransferase RsmD [Candidatus Polarisedimenticola svalbardensis]